MKKLLATTFDNPYNPFTEFDEWRRFDVDAGYYTCEYLARIANIADELSEVDNDLEINRAARRLVELDPLGIYRLVEEPTPSPHGEPEKSPPTPNRAPS